MPTYAEFQDWDPLTLTSTDDPSLFEEMRRQDIRNILGSYTGLYDVFSELIQNSLDALDERIALSENANYQPTLWIYIDIKNQTLTVRDNGIGLSRDQLRLFLQPSISFKKKGTTRGEKGVGATYLAYGFNYLQIATRWPDFEYVGILENGRDWVEDRSNSVTKPKIRAVANHEGIFDSIDRGTSFTIKLSEKGKPKDLAWIGATTAKQWGTILRIKTPLGGIYLSQKSKPKTVCYLNVVDSHGQVTEEVITECEFFYPDKIDGKRVRLRQLIEHVKKAGKAGRPPNWPPELSRLTAIYDIFSTDEILNDSIINPQLIDDQPSLMEKHKPDVYVFFAYSTRIWNDFNDNQVKLRQKTRILRGGLQLATKGMTQGDLLQIPLTQSTYFQNTTYVLVHFYNAEPDLGRKGFQLELRELAEALSTACVATFKKWHGHLRQEDGQPPHLFADVEKYQWITLQEKHATEHPLKISGPGLFAPEEVIPITSTPLCEQDVIALFNQLLAAGVIRGVHILATSGTQRYDGVIKFHTEQKDKFIYNPHRNPLGIPSENIQENTTTPMILEYKFTLDMLIDDFSKETKFERNVDLVVVWTIGEKWKEKYRIIPLLHNNYVHDRYFHGITHDIRDGISGSHAFYAVILDELVQYLEDPEGVQEKIRKKYLEDF